MYYLIPHDGTKEGDNEFWAPTNCKIDKAPTSIKGVRDIWRTWMTNNGYDDIEEINYVLQEIKGAWIIDEDTKNLMHAVCISIDPRNDTESYCCNKACKAIASYMRKQSVGSLI